MVDDYGALDDVQVRRGLLWKEPLDPRDLGPSRGEGVAKGLDVTTI